MIVFRLRRPLHVKTREMRDLEALTGMTIRPEVIPARTDLTLVDIGMDGVLAVLPDGRRLWVNRETCRDHAYKPRGERTSRA